MTHWYDAETGQPVYQVPSAKGGTLRDTTLRDARKMNLVCGVTTIMAEMAKPQLEAWKVKQALLSCLTLERWAGESLDDFMKRADQDARKQSQEAAERGTLIHNAVETHYKGGYVSSELRPFVDGIVTAIDDHFGAQEWTAEECFASPLGYGGKVDLNSRKNLIVVDFKGKDFKEGDTAEKLAFDENGIQLSAYAIGLFRWRQETEENARRVNVYFDRQNAGKVMVYEWPKETFSNHFERFQCCLKHYQLRNDFSPNH